jgi:hypothetical protein
MVQLFGKLWRADEIRKKIGSMDQLAGIRSFTFNDGRANGVRAFEVRNGSGLCFTVQADRGMDIAYAEFCGVPISWISSAGVVSPVYHERSGRSFNRTFGGGLLTTCGLTQAGEPGIDIDGEELGLHGRISNTPAECCFIDTGWQNDDYVVSIFGQMRERQHESYNLLLKRNITTRMSSPALEITDIVANEGFSPAPLMLIYHINIGFPIVDDDTCIFSDAASFRKVYDAKNHGPETFGFGGPDCEKQMYLHEFDKGAKKVCAGMFNPVLGLGIRVRFSLEQLPFLMQWKMLRWQYNVVALEPANCYAWDGRVKARESGNLPMIEPGECKTFKYTIEIIQKAEESSIIAEI